MFGKNKDLEKLREVVEIAVSEAINGSIGETRKALEKMRDLKSLEQKIATLEVEKGKKEWEYEKKEMAIEHKVGLERKRQDFEIEQASREATVGVREENLKADQDRFKTEIEFTRKRFEDEVGYLKDLMGQVLERLPDISMEIKRNGERQLSDGNGDA